MSAVVCHGGHGTTVAALAHALPVLAIPLDAKTDQPYLGDALERLGVGRKLSKRAKPAAIRTAVESLLADGPHRAAAARLADSIAAHDGRNGGASLIESMLTPKNAPGQPPNQVLPRT
jgi:UDP:flavonoid glycosyltransferase YjiC (YdhE family)